MANKIITASVLTYFKHNIDALFGRNTDTEVKSTVTPYYATGDLPGVVKVGSNLSMSDGKLNAKEQIYIGDEEPTDTEVKFWLDTDAEE